MSTLARDLFSSNPHKLSGRVERYLSGGLSQIHWERCTRDGAPVCVVASEMSNPECMRALAYAAQGRRILLDTGAFLYRDAPESMPWQKVLQVYAKVLRHAKGCITAILPGTVGDQPATLALLRAYGASILHMCGDRHKALLPLQWGIMPAAVYVNAAIAALGRVPDGLVIPSRETAYPTTALSELSLVTPALPRRVHFLGLGRNARAIRERMVVLSSVWPKVTVSCDACEHPSLIDQDLATWEETEDEVTREDAGDALQSRTGETLAPERTDDLACSQLGAMLQLDAFRRRQIRARGSEVTREPI